MQRSNAHPIHQSRSGRGAKFDRWGNQMVVNALAAGGFCLDPDERGRDGAPMLVQFGQGYASMGPATKALEE